MLRCSDGSYYVGSTSYDDVEQRVADHNDAKFEGYTAKRRPVVLVWSDWYQDVRDSQNMERQIKGWRRDKKLALLRGDINALRMAAKRPGARRPSRPGVPEQ